MKKPRHRKRNRTEKELDSFEDDCSPRYGQAEEWTGMVVIQCGTADEIRPLHRLLQGKSIYVNNHSATARVDAPAVDLSF